MAKKTSIKQIADIADEIEKDLNLDIAMPKVANGGYESEKVIIVTTLSEKYKITLSKKLETPSVSDHPGSLAKKLRYLFQNEKKQVNEESESWLVTLEALGKFTELEGQEIVVREKKGNRLLQGKICGREVSGWWHGKLEKLDLSFISVIPKG
ncbi:MAG: hypothetical protein GY749_11030 [Desulfobacteraceae bacterium]|nr:hypothetical protein [Desulfobacteraceae bacterium]